MIVHQQKKDYQIFKYLFDWLSKKKLLNKKNILFIPLLLFFGIFLQKKGVPYQIKTTFTKGIDQVFSTYYRITTPANKFLNLNISFKNLETLEVKRNTALSQGILAASDEDFVKADIEYQNQQIPVKVRLKGDWLDHLRTDKWSFRVETRKDTSFLGMSRFSLQIPESRQNINEWLFLNTLKDEGIISLQYDFLKVNLNGDNKGIYALEEHFSKEVLERNQRREGPIIKFNEDDFWQTIKRLGGETRFFARKGFLDDLYFTSIIEPFQLGQIISSPELSDLTSKALSKLSSLRNKILSPSEVFDYETWSTYLALADIFGANHGTAWHNLRLYFNPITGKFEPIPFDNEPGFIIDHISLGNKETGPLTILFQDDDFTSLYFQKLKKFSQNEYVGQKLSDYQDQIDYFQRLLRQDDPHYTFSSTNFFENADFVRQTLYAKQGIRATIPNNTSPDHLFIENLLKFPVTITNITNENDQELLYQEIGLPQFTPNSPLIQTKIFTSSTINPLETITISYKLSWLDDIYQTNAISQTLPDYSSPLIKNLSLASFIKYDSVNNRYFIPSGNWSLNNLTIIPANSSLYISPGTSIKFINQSAIISYSPINFDGRENNPINITASDNGQGILVINANDKSFINYTNFHNLNNIDQQDHITTGAVTFYQSDVDIINSNFANNKSEDSLNVISSTFLLSSSHFSNTFSDAVDIDFGSGKVETSSFTNIGNDALDFSGSIADVFDVRIDSVGDKGISVGERSTINIKASEIKNSNLGIASKDLSEVNIDGVTLTNIKVGVAAYQKKPEYGPAYISQKVINANNLKIPYLIEIGSTLTIPLEVINGTEVNLGDRFQ